MLPLCEVITGVVGGIRGGKFGSQRGSSKVRVCPADERAFFVDVREVWTRTRQSVKDGGSEEIEWCWLFPES